MYSVCACRQFAESQNSTNVWTGMTWFSIITLATTTKTELESMAPYHHRLNSKIKMQTHVSKNIFWSTNLLQPSIGVQNKITSVSDPDHTGRMWRVGVEAGAEAEENHTDWTISCRKITGITKSITLTISRGTRADFVFPLRGQINHVDIALM